MIAKLVGKSVTLEDAEKQVEVLQPRYQRRTYSWPTRSLEEVEEASPEPEHTKYEDSIAEARRALFG